LLLVILEGLLPGLSPYLPLGRSHAAQIGILFGTTWAICEIVASLRKAKSEPPLSTYRFFCCAG